MPRYLLILAALCLLSMPVHPQELPEKEVKEAVYRIAALIEDNYVLEEKGKEIAEDFVKDFNSGRFAFARNWRQLDSVMSKSLNEISKDGHLYTRNDPEIVQRLKQEPADEKEEVSSFFNNETAFNTNFGFQKIEVIEGNIGYIKLSKINISKESLETLYASMDFVKNTKALIIDLRNNGGGGSIVGAVLESYFFERETELLEFTNRSAATHIEKTVPWLLERRYTRPLYILINRKTASAAEAFAFVLKHHHRATVVGEPSAGAANMSTYFLVNDHLILSVSTEAPFIPGTRLTWEGTGVQPDTLVNEKEAKETALELISRELE